MISPTEPVAEAAPCREQTQQNRSGFNSMPPYFLLPEKAPFASLTQAFKALRETTTAC